MGFLFSILKIFLGIVLIIWIVGLIWFSETIHRPPQDVTTQTDAIVVLTGGSNRLEAGVKLLKNKSAKKLFISGVSKQVSIKDLKVKYDIESLGPNHLELGYEASNTKENAKETYQWLRQNNFKTIRLVTANYHMPRSILEFKYYMPDIDVIPHPIDPDNVHLDDWWSWTGTLNLLIREYNKLILVYFNKILLKP